MFRINQVRFKEKNVTIPPSKSETHRALIIAALNKGTSTIQNPLWAEDTEITRQALINMGTGFEMTDNQIHTDGTFGNVRNPHIQLMNSGSSARFLLPVGCLANHPIHFRGSERLHQRPVKTLIEVLKKMGASIEDTDGYFPVTTHPSTLAGGNVIFRGIPSSQYVTALILTASRMKKDLEIIFEDEIPSMPYIELTVRLLKRVGIPVEMSTNEIFVPSAEMKIDFTFHIGQDMSSASYWVAMALIHRAKVEFTDMRLPSLQGDEAIFKIAADLGSNVMVYQNKVIVEGEMNKGLRVDCRGIPDLVPALSVIALFAPETSRFENVQHLKYKESDRIEAIRQNIHALGGRSEYQDGTLIIYPQKQYHGAKIECFNDHRIAMSFSVAGSKIGNVIIDQPESVMKSYPTFWVDFPYFKPIKEEN
jgi:3-phosphoshikimate 1-carboxyvinyltransferase